MFSLSCGTQTNNIKKHTILGTDYNYLTSNSNQGMSDDGKRLIIQEREDADNLDTTVSKIQILEYSNNNWTAMKIMKNRDFIFGETPGYTVNEIVYTTSEYVATEYNDIDFFGRSVAMSGDGNHVAIGAAKYNNGTTAGIIGLVDIYKWDIDSLQWNHVIQLTPTGSSNNNDQYGLCVSLSFNGSCLGVSQFGYDDGMSNKGRVFIYTTDDYVDYAIQKILLSDDPKVQERFGIKILLNRDGDICLIHSRFDEDGELRGRNPDEWTNKTFSNSDTNNTEKLAGTNYMGTNFGRGRVYIFIKDNNEWLLKETITGEQNNSITQTSGGGIGSNQGLSMSNKENNKTTIVISAPNYGYEQFPISSQENDTEKGRLYIYTYNHNNNTVSDVVQTINTEVSGSKLGSFVQLSQDSNTLMVRYDQTKIGYYKKSSTGVADQYEYILNSVYDTTFTITHLQTSDNFKTFLVTYKDDNLYKIRIIKKA